jgi:hypothetical protein
MKASLALLVSVIILCSSIANAQLTPKVYSTRAQSVVTEANTTDNDGRTHLSWAPLLKEQFTDEITLHSLYFTGAIYSDKSHELPIYSQRLSVPSGNSMVFASLSEESFVPIESADANKLADLSQIGEQIEIVTAIRWHRKRPHGVVSFVPLRFNPASGKYEQLTAFKLNTSVTQDSQSKQSGQKTASYATNSVLGTGTWYKLSVDEDGIHRIDYDDLVNMGVDLGSVNPQNMRIYGNGGGMLPKANSEFRYDDLEENAIEVVGESDGVFNATDYILFYGESPNQWDFTESDGRFHHEVHDYSKKTYYYLAIDAGAGTPKRIVAQNADVGENITTSSFDDYEFHEQDLTNLLMSGREWYGEHFDIVNSYSFPFSFPNRVASSQVYYRSGFLGRAVLPVSSYSFNLSSSGLNVNYTGTNVGNGNYLKDVGKIDTQEGSFNPSSANFTLTVSNNTPGSTTGWLDYVELNARRQLKMSGNQMAFRDADVVAIGNIAKYSLANSTTSLKVWEVTDPTNVVLQETIFSGSNTEFVLAADSLREFIAYNGNTFLAPGFVGAIPNQDIHGTIGQPDLVIVTHADFYSAAADLADFHSENDNLEVAVVKINELFNEFSSGAQDATAIKSLMRMLYKRAVDSIDLPRYLLLMGDGSFDHKGRLAINSNYIPTFQSANSYNPIATYVSDDYYGLLDDAEGESASEPIDIGIGRIPVRTSEQAQAMVEKIKHYHDPATMRNWRNTLCFVADDEDFNLHLNQSDGVAMNTVSANYKDYDIDKIYLDAYNQESTPGGQRYPSATDAINNRVERGALIINYTGHGGELGWAHERVLENSDINSWSNYDRLPLFMTATCEFSRYDDPERTAAGEYVFLNPAGGAIAMLTTTRVVTSGSNLTLTTALYQNVFEPINGEMPRLGDVYMKTKNSAIDAGAGAANTRKFALLGDPAIRLAYPKNVILTDSINQQVTAGTADTLKALSKVTISGHIEDESGNKLTNFNGTVYPTVFDKAVSVTTLANDPNSSAKTFNLQKNALFRGKASVVNGVFSFSFIVPKDIAYQPGQGRISYYAENGVTDGNGPYEDFIIGGTSSNIETDLSGPQVQLYLNDTNFVDGGLTDENPVLLAYVYDDHGINTTGNGIGHDIVAILDGETNNPYVLNDDYEADRDNYKSGSVSYPFSGLSEGPHELSFKVWDVYNNSAQVFTDFIVAQSAKLALSHVLNYPNPFTTYTEFWFEHNRPGEQLDVQIQVFTISGRLVKTINADIVTQGFRPDPGQWTDLQWDGKDDFGDNIGRGVYVYHLQVRAPSGDYADEYEKLVILK